MDLKRYLLLTMIASGWCPVAAAHHPDHRARPVAQPIDLIGPLGNRLPMSYRRRYNRPTYAGGKLAYHLAPSSQEAMRWHEAEHRGYYRGDVPRMIDHYFYPRPWEMIPVGPRPAPQQGEDSPARDRSTTEQP